MSVLPSADAHRDFDGLVSLLFFSLCVDWWLDGCFAAHRDAYLLDRTSYITSYSQKFLSHRLILELITSHIVESQPPQKDDLVGTTSINEQ